MDEELDGVGEADSDARNDTTPDEHVGIVAFSLQTSTERQNIPATCFLLAITTEPTHHPYEPNTSLFAEAELSRPEPRPFRDEPGIG
jgi:hypothetical protein